MLQRNTSEGFYRRVAAHDLIYTDEGYVIEANEYGVTKNVQKERDKGGIVMACSYNKETWESGAIKGRPILESRFL